LNAFEEKEYSEKIDFNIWKKLLKHLWRYKKQAAGLMFVMAMVAAFDLLTPLMTRYAINTIIGQEKFDQLPVFGALFMLGSIIQGTNIWLFIRFAGWLEAQTAHDIRQEAFKHCHELTFAFHDRTPVGYLMARLTGDISRLGETIGWTLVDITWSVAIILGTIGVMLALDWRLALIVLVVIPPLALIALFFQRRILKLQRLVRKTNSQITRAQNESIVGAKTTKTLVREERNLQEFQLLTNTRRNASINSQVLNSLFWPMIMTLGSVATGVALWRGGVMTVGGAMTLGTLSAFISYAGQFFDPITNLARIFAELQNSQASAERVVGLVDTPLEIIEKPGVEEKYGTLFEPKRENWPRIKGDVTFEHVSFHYNKGEQVLEDFSLEVKAGQTIALVGETGAGKSTIVNMLCRFYEPVEGKILIDGVEYRERSQLWLQSNLGFVLQSPHLFSGTIRDNIRYGKMDATDEEVRWAARLVSADGFIEKLENGYDTQVGEGGSRLSTGEKQLISFARAVITDPRIFVLDEATSSVDTETEQLIQNAITSVLDGRTSFIIAHRLSTIRKADLILVVRGGRVVEQGSHHELMKKHGYYYDLYTNQFRDEASQELLGA
jgi:ATP-binding cassette subfamily B protein